MDLEQINAILDAVWTYITENEKEKAYLRQLVANKDKVIERLQAQLTTCTTVLSTTDEESATMHDKLSRLWDLMFPGEFPPK